MNCGTIAGHGGKAPGGAPKNVPSGQPLPGAVERDLTNGQVENAKLEKLRDFYRHKDYVPPAKRPD